MGGFSYKEIYIEDGKRVLEVNILPEKHCNFDCIFCPIGRSPNKVDTQKSFDKTDSSLIELEGMIESTKAEVIFINSKGEALVNEKIIDVINIIKGKGLQVKLLSNGYILNWLEFKEIANMCEEVIGEIKVISNEDFQKIQRPIGGYTFENHISNMKAFREQYKGKFILEVTILKGYTDDEESIQKIKNIIKEISPNKIITVRMEDEIFKKKLGITDERFEEISNEILNV
ncbi:radical SAM protein [Clostridium sp. CF011]|uniref:radical SAM protein n=1 Tax=unclassified Clostridium TaxID=2614128 RepID=UPI001C0B398B|nr:MULTISPECIES: radical SAM protein [unclassified Clostridium]MBU3091751.1 radical SAM protein [Clostridium sp. CF011]MBW9144747.1 radical SAM protein [Clostridium sp. CM027]UVE40504.1 radical SAM protein [Clostridium sp. CM027]WAG69459.1 radical SAM protein [Clostridium sp. CF011]